MSVAMYQKIPVKVKAIRFTRDTIGECVQFLEDNGARYLVNHDELWVELKFQIVTSEGYINVSEGDYIVRDAECECYPCKPDIFAKTYECVEV